MSILRLNCTDPKLEEFKQSRKELGISFFETLTAIAQPIIDNNHPRVKSTIDAIESEKMRFNTRERERDWICAVLNKAGVINTSTYSRIRTPDHNIFLSQVISICIFLGIDLEDSVCLIDAAGYSLRPNNKLHNLYEWLIQKSHEEATDAIPLDKGNLKYHSLMSECNKFLIENGIESEQAMLGIRSKKKSLN